MQPNLRLLLRAATFAATLAVSVSSPAQTTTPASPSPTAPATAAPARAEWLERLTLGAGDRVNLSLLGSPELTQPGVLIGPDGRISYLEAQDVMAAGATIDELRTRIDAELSKFRRAPRTIITPAAFQSKKYYVMGQVAGQGVFTLDRPMTVIEAVARARGLTGGGARTRMTDYADLSHSYLMRGGQRVPVDFEKLFLQGDLSQNAFLQPGDYLYFASPAPDANLYVLGEVQQAGIAPFARAATAVSAITTRGGFTTRAWKQQVLVVRGSMQHPQTFAVNVGDVLAARIPDFPLEPNDIVYVSARPWIKIEEIFDAAASAFVQAGVIVWTGDHVYNTVR